MKPYCLIIIKDQKLRMEYYFECKQALKRAHNLMNEYRDEEMEFVCYRTADNVICFTLSQREEDTE